MRGDRLGVAAVVGGDVRLTAARMAFSSDVLFGLLFERLQSRRSRAPGFRLWLLLFAGVGDGGEDQDCHNGCRCPSAGGSCVQC